MSRESTLIFLRIFFFVFSRRKSWQEIFIRHIYCLLLILVSFVIEGTGTNKVFLKQKKQQKIYVKFLLFLIR